MAKSKDEHSNRTRDEFTVQIESLTGLNDQQKTYLRLRWLEQMMWLSNSANKARDRYYLVKRLTILSGVLIPVLISSNIGSTIDAALGTSLTGIIDGVFKIVATILGLLIAASNGLNEFFKYNDRWQNYRTSSELLKAEWWYFYSLTGRYDGFEHAKAFDDFTERVESTLRQDLKTYVATVVKDSKKKPQSGVENI